jgi:hypothetical protein
MQGRDMKQWEYKVHWVTTREEPSAAALEATLLTLGADGWELCGVLQHRLIFKRPGVAE